MFVRLARWRNRDHREAVMQCLGGVAMILGLSRSVSMNAVGCPGNKNCGLLTVLALVCVLGVMFSAAACGQGRSSPDAKQQKVAAIDPAQKRRIEQLYAEDAEAWSRHDLAKIVSLIDPACVFVAPDGKRTSYAQWRQYLPASFEQERHSQVKTTVKTVQDLGNGFVASVEWHQSYEMYDPKRSAWIPMALFAPQEDTWRSDGHGNFKLVLVKFLRTEASPVVVQSGGYDLTEEMLQRALAFAQILAGVDFSPSDAAALRADLITYFKKEPAKEMEAHESFANLLEQAPPSSFDGK